MCRRTWDSSTLQSRANSVLRSTNGHFGIYATDRKMHPPFTIYLNKLSVLQNEVHISYLGKMLPFQFRHKKAWQIISSLYVSGTKTNETIYSNADSVHTITNTFTSKYNGFLWHFLSFFSPTPPRSTPKKLLERHSNKVYFKCSYAQVRSWNKCTKYLDINLSFGFWPQLTSSYTFNSFPQHHTKNDCHIGLSDPQKCLGPLKFNFRSWEKSAPCQH